MALRREDISRLPLDERLRLVEDIWDSIYADEEQVPATDAQREELHRRLVAHRTDPGSATDLDDVLDRLRTR